MFVVPPFTGHVNPTVPVAKVLAQRGHEVAWTGVPGATTDTICKSTTDSEPNDDTIVTRPRSGSLSARRNTSVAA